MRQALVFCLVLLGLDSILVHADYDLMITIHSV
jgi:hypothetical protein